MLEGQREELLQQGSRGVERGERGAKKLRIFSSMSRTGLSSRSKDWKVLCVGGGGGGVVVGGGGGWGGGGWGGVGWGVWGGGVCGVGGWETRCVGTVGIGGKCRGANFGARNMGKNTI